MYQWVIAYESFTIMSNIVTQSVKIRELTLKEWKWKLVEYTNTSNLSDDQEIIT